MSPGGGQKVRKTRDVQSVTVSQPELEKSSRASSRGILMYSQFVVTLFSQVSHDFLICVVSRVCKQTTDLAVGPKRPTLDSYGL